MIAQLLPANQSGALLTDDCRVISTILPFLRSGYQWRNCSVCYGPATTVCNRFYRWYVEGIWRQEFGACRCTHVYKSSLVKPKSIPLHVKPHSFAAPFCSDFIHQITMRFGCRAGGLEKIAFIVLQCFQPGSNITFPDPPSGTHFPARRATPQKHNSHCQTSLSFHGSADLLSRSSEPAHAVRWRRNWPHRQKGTVPAASFHR